MTNVKTISKDCCQKSMPKMDEEKRITVDILEEAVSNDFGCIPSDVTIINYTCSAGETKRKFHKENLVLNSLEVDHK